MGWLDRLRGRGGANLGLESAPEPPLDVPRRTAQLVVLADALDDLAAAMRADEANRFNPGWTGRMQEYARAAARARELRHGGFEREHLLDLVAEIRPLYVRGSTPPDPAVEALLPLQERVLSAAAALRAPLPTET